MKNASDKQKKYFQDTISSVKKAFEIGQKARQQGHDASSVVDIKLAENLAERVVGLISVIAPEVENPAIVTRIQELEEIYGILDWRVALKIALEIAQENFCKFKSKIKAMEIGIKLGFAYVTVGVVSSPLEGFTDLEIKKRKDGKEYFCMNFAGPIRNAGGTSASVSVIIGDYVRYHMGYAPFDATDDEANRCFVEISDYHERVTNLQYFPSKEEILFLVKHMPIEIGGMPSEVFEVSSYKDLPRIPTNLIRSGYCLMYSSCIPLKAPKLWKNLANWKDEFGITHWSFLDEFLGIQKSAKSRGKKVTEVAQILETQDVSSDLKEIFEYTKSIPKVGPDYTYVTDLVAGRPILSHPLKSGGLRLRYGKARNSGYSAQCISPATLSVLRDFVTTATQLKVERPGKAAAITTCDTITGPIVLLKNGAVIEVESEKQGISLREEIKEILYLGDVLINYGDFFDRAHKLCPPGYCEEWWSQELEKAITEYGADGFKKHLSQIAELAGIAQDSLSSYIIKPFQKVSARQALTLSKILSIPLHPQHTYFWTQINFEQFVSFLKYISSYSLDSQDMKSCKMLLPISQEKRIFELLGIPHFVTAQYVILENKVAAILLELLSLAESTKFITLFNYSVKLLKESPLLDGHAVLFVLNKFSPIVIRDKAGTFIGARMGRPEKAKMRKMQGSPHGLFPVGEEGGRFKSFQGAMEKGYVESEFGLWWDAENKEESIFPLNYKTGVRCAKKFWDAKSKLIVDEDTEDRWVKSSKVMKYDLPNHIRWCLSQMKTKVYPDLVRGIQETISTDKAPEHPMKAILRAKYDLYVNKDGTIRYDASEVPLTHFKPLEIGTSILKLKELGYTHDIYGQPLTRDDQICELFAQDVVLPACTESPYEPADQVFFRVTKFIDEELKYLYKLPAYYKAKSPSDLVGQYVIVLAPHTSAGSIGRIVGFSRTQGLFCHPLMHAAIRRDCFSYDSFIPIKKEGAWKIMK
jgi:DNA polymerase II large subunit